MQPDEHARIVTAIELWFQAKADAAERSAASGRAQEGRRSQVTGGLHLAGFEALLLDEIRAAGAHNPTIGRNRGATLAGFYRPSKAWDLVVLEQGSPVLAVEFKSMSGSEGNNLNNRADEMFGVAEDAKQAEAHSILPANMQRAFVFIMEANANSLIPRRAVRAHGNPDPAFARQSYLERMATMLSRMRETGLYHAVWALGAVREPRSFIEPMVEVGWDRFRSDLRAGFTHADPAS